MTLPDLLGDRATLVSLTPLEIQRYARHLIMPEVAMSGQKRLKAARVLCIGTGGLGSPLSLYLAAAGVGTLGLVDFDVVDSSNLQRQVIHSTSTVGMLKVDSASLNYDVFQQSQRSFDCKRSNSQLLNFLLRHLLRLWLAEP